MCNRHKTYVHERFEDNCFIVRRSAEAMTMRFAPLDLTFTVTAPMVSEGARYDACLHGLHDLVTVEQEECGRVLKEQSEEKNSNRLLDELATAVDAALEVKGARRCREILRTRGL